MFEILIRLGRFIPYAGSTRASVTGIADAGTITRC